MRVQSLLQLAQRCSQLASASGLHVELASLGRRWLLLLHEEVLMLGRAIRDLVRRAVPALIERPGVGIHSAAQLLITAGGNPDRLHSDAAFAALYGASPVQASSGQRQRHRLSPAATARRTTPSDHREQPHDPRSTDPRVRRPTTPDRRQPQGQSACPKTPHRPRDLQHHPGRAARRASRA